MRTKPPPSLLILGVVGEAERMLRDVIVVTTPYVPGYEVVRVLGLVYGLTVRTRGFWG